VAQTASARDKGFLGAKIKIGRPHLSEDLERLRAVREAVGDRFELMVDANQAFNSSEALRRAQGLQGLNLAWLEEPMPADDVMGHAGLRSKSPIPIAVGESLYSMGNLPTMFVPTRAMSYKLTWLGWAVSRLG